MATEKESNRGAGAYSTPGVDQKPDLSPAQIITGAPEVSFGHKNLAPPSQLYITREDALVVTIWNSAPGATVDVNYRILRFDGVIVPNSTTVAPPSTRVRNSFIFPLTEGFLLSLQLFNLGNPALRGQLFCDVQIVRPQTGTVKGYATLLQDYLTNGANLGWPGGRINESTEGPGWTRIISGTTPAAGAEITETCPTNARWRLVSFSYTLVTSAGVANRETVLVQDDGANSPYASASGFIQAASLTHFYNFSTTGTRYEGAVSTRTQAPFASAFLLSGGRMRTATSNIQAADAYSAPIYQVEEWIET